VHHGKTTAALLGGGGFIGSHLVKRLAGDGGYRAVCLDISEEKLKKIVPAGGYEFHACDIRRDNSPAEEIIEQADIVVDLIAYATPSLYLEMPIEVVKLNFFENLKIAESCMRSRKPLVQFSTCEVYGKSGGKSEPFNEDKTDIIMGPVCKQRWIYSCAKQLLERMLYAWGEEGSLDYLIIRPFNFIGPEMDYVVTEEEVQGKPRVFPEFISALLFNRPMKLVDGGSSRRTFTHIDDAVEGIVLCLKQFDNFRNQIVNVGNPENEISIRDLAHLMRDIYEKLGGEKSLSQIKEVTGAQYYGPGYDDCDRRIPDITKLSKAGWKPRYGLHDTMADIIGYYLKNYRKIPKQN